MKTNKAKPKIFLSYTHEDIGIAKKLYCDLKRFGLDVWIDCECLLPGQNWKITIEKTIRQSQYYLLLLSSHSITKRGFIQKEMKSAYEMLEQCSEDDIYMIPVRLNECTPSLKISHIHYIDIFPDSEYQKGLKKILKVVSEGTFVLRSEPKELSQADVTETIISHDFYETFRNPGGKGFNHQYHIKNMQEDNIIFDEITGFMWQQSGSNDLMDFEQAKDWILELNKKGFAGYYDWRLPTVEEAMSLMESEEKKGLYIDSVFDGKQSWIWTADLAQAESGAWVIFFLTGLCSYSPWYHCYCVRAVRSGQSSYE
jgi:hypothetical protein